MCFTKFRYFAMVFSNLNAFKKMIKFCPLEDNILLKRLNDKQKTDGGVILPDDIVQKATQGVVIAVGPGTRDEKMISKKGDIVLFYKEPKILLESMSNLSKTAINNLIQQNIFKHNPYVYKQD